MPLTYSVIEIFSNEEARCQGKPLPEAIVNHIRKLKIAARCIVTRGIGGCYENGEVATQNIVILSFNMPLKIEIVLPSAELDLVLPAIEEMVCEGIVTLRSAEVRCHKTRKRLIPRQFKVRDIMTPSPEAVTVSTPVSEVVRLLLSSVFTGVPVVDKDHRPLGIISQGDLIYRAGMPMRLGLLAKSDPVKMNTFLESLAHKRAEEIMSHPAVSIKEDEQAVEAVNLMLKRNLKRLPVVNAAGRLVGILSRLDVFRTVMAESPDWKTFRGQDIHVDNLRLVSDIMRRDTHTVLHDTSVEEILRFIDSNDIQRVAVVDKNGRLLGLISDQDLLTAFSDSHPGIWDYFMSLLPLGDRKRNIGEFGDTLRSKTAEEVMTTDFITIEEHATIDEAIRLMTKNSLHRLPVLDSEGKFKGMISRDALLRIGFGN